MSNPNAGPGKCISAPSRSHISRPSTSENVCLTSIQVIPHLTFPRLLSHPLHAPSHIDSCPKILQFMLHLTSNQAMMLASHIHPFHVSHPSRSRGLLLSSIPVPPLYISRSQDVCLNPIQVPSHPQVSIYTFHLHPGSYINTSSPFRPHFTSINITIIVYHLHPIEVSLPSRSCLT